MKAGEGRERSGVLAGKQRREGQGEHRSGGEEGRKGTAEERSEQTSQYLYFSDYIHQRNDSLLYI